MVKPRYRCPDPLLAHSVTWSKQDLADLTQQADNLLIRNTEQGTVYPPPGGALASMASADA